MTDEVERGEALRRLARLEVVATLDGEANTTVRTTTFTGADGAALPMDLHLPAHAAGRRPPVVVFATGFPDPDGRMRAFGPVTSWARLLAAAGTAAIVYGTREPGEDVRALLETIRRNGATLGVNGERIALFASSGHGPVALSAAAQARQLAGAALLYPYTLDLDGGEAVARAAKQFGFVPGRDGISVRDLEATPLLFVRAGRDEMPRLNETLDALVTRLVAGNTPVTLVNHASGIHGFDLHDRSQPTLQVLEFVVGFLVRHLGLPAPVLTLRA
ncbi:MAG: alpha/beta hydrolase [Vicinamibacterales bacterium]